MCDAYAAAGTAGNARSEAGAAAGMAECARSEDDAAARMTGCARSEADAAASFLAGEAVPAPLALAEQGDSGNQSTWRRKDSGDKAQIPGGSPCKG